MTDFCGIPLVSLRENSITRLNLRGNGVGVGVPGAIVLSKLLPSAVALTSLECACRPHALDFVSAPLGMPAPRPSLGSLSGNDVGEKGATAIAAILNETKITKLKCAAAPYVRFRVSAH